MIEPPATHVLTIAPFDGFPDLPDCPTCPRMANMIARVWLFVVGLLLAQSAAAGQQPAGNTSPTQPGRTLLGRPSPPQPLQKQGLEYFTGAWSFSWTGRESPLTPGPRKGTVTYTLLGTTPFLEFRIEGTAEGTGAYQESGTMGWHASQRILAIHEQLPGGVDMLSLGDWTSPIAIRFESAPVAAQGQRLRLRRVYSIVSAHSFTVSEELSTNDGPFLRLGGGVFTKQTTP